MLLEFNKKSNFITILMQKFDLNIGSILTMGIAWFFDTFGEYTMGGFDGNCCWSLLLLPRRRASST